MSTPGGPKGEDSTDALVPQRYAVLGNPVSHSQSPFIHAAFAQQTGQNMAYTRVLCAMDGFADNVRAFAASGARGCNVTVPFKFQAVALARHVTPRAALAQAANLLRFDAGGWWADNTDGIGLVRDIERNAVVALRGCRVLLIGAGGAAAGVLGPLIEAQPQQVHVANRTPDKAAALVQRHATLAASVGVRLCSSGLNETASAYDVVLNSSASSLAGAAVPVSDAALRPGTLALDLMYGTSARPFMAWAQRLGAVPRDGLGMLVEQAAEAFFVWRQVMPETQPVLQRLRAHLDAGTTPP